MTWLDLVLFTGSVYGAAWGLSKSGLLAPLRRAVEPIPLVGKLVQCIVCTAAWLALGLVLALPGCTLFSGGFRAHTVGDGVVLVFWAVAATWALGRLLGDAWLAEDGR